MIYVLNLSELDGCADCAGGNRNCANIYDPENGYSQGQCTPGLVGQNCQFGCNPGYSLEGLFQVSCLEGGQWSGNPPSCRRMSGMFSPLYDSVRV